jgi:hypothetical protein
MSFDLSSKARRSCANLSLLDLVRTEFLLDGSVRPVLLKLRHVGNGMRAHGQKYDWGGVRYLSQTKYLELEKEKRENDRAIVGMLWRIYQFKK